MLQQTRVETVIPYYLRWLEKFPTVSALAHSSQDDVLKAWEGLGYYSRARNLHKAAKLVIDKFDGKIPNQYFHLIRLPGIGPSSAADILSVAYGVNLAALDGNIKRVLARLFNIGDVLDSPEFLDSCRQLLDKLLPEGKAGDFNQAMMDLGAVICLPKNPACINCPLISDCLAYQHNNQVDRPLPKPKKEIPHFIVTAGVIHDSSGKVLIARRPANGLLGGMWEFPGGKVHPGERLEECLIRELKEELDIDCQVGNPLGTYRHAYTHFRVTLHAYECQIIQGIPTPLSADELNWVELDDLEKYPMGKLDRMITSRVIRNE